VSLPVTPVSIPYEIISVGYLLHWTKGTSVGDRTIASSDWPPETEGQTREEEEEEGEVLGGIESEHKTFEIIRLRSQSWPSDQFWIIF
jgi:hypothetical protein